MKNNIKFFCRLCGQIEISIINFFFKLSKIPLNMIVEYIHFLEQILLLTMFSVCRPGSLALVVLPHMLPHS